MPIIKSAKKRVKVTAKASARNSKTKRSLREALKTFEKAIASGKPAEITKAQNTAVSALDRAAKKNLLHKNKAARQKANLSAQAKAAGVKLAKSSKPKAKTQASVKKSPAKKPTAKKPAAKKKTS